MSVNRTSSVRADADDGAPGRLAEQRHERVARPCPARSARPTPPRRHASTSAWIEPALGEVVRGVDQAVARALMRTSASSCSRSRSTAGGRPPR